MTRQTFQTKPWASLFSYQQKLDSTYGYDYKNLQRFPRLPKERCNARSLFFTHLSAVHHCVGKYTQWYYLRTRELLLEISSVQTEKNTEGIDVGSWVFTFIFKRTLNQFIYERKLRKLKPRWRSRMWLTPERCFLPQTQTRIARTSCLPKKLFADLVCHGLIISQVCVDAQGIFSQQHFFLFQYCKTRSYLNFLS